MDRYVADLHIHSRFSRATSKALNPRLLAAWARIKGVDVLGTGDFTHPQWIDELEDMLAEVEDSGLFVLKEPEGLEKELPWEAGPLSGVTRFMLQAEISSIYKKGGKVRKVHNLVYMPDFESARRFNHKLAQVGNLSSDGRPILGLDSKLLLEMVLQTHPKAFLIPAHVWTPWFSLFGSKSGFDSIEECFGDLSSEIFALETGLSSDPEMNWMLSALDRFKLVSNSDAHSGEKLAREANLFAGEPSYDSIYGALKGEGLGQRFLGTIEFFPEEGKYHMDGHRKCGVVLDPAESRMRGGLCPVCGKPLTAGVLSRVLDLADRNEGVRPPGAAGYVSLVPLKEMLSEVLGVGPGTKKVQALYTRLMDSFGSELSLLRSVPPEDIRRVNIHVAEGVDRMRRGEVIRTPGFDGQYGVIRVFTDQERAEFKKGRTLLKLTKPKGSKKPRLTLEAPEPEPAPVEKRSPEPVEYNLSQQRAIDAGPGPVLVLAGPGTGKTQTLMGRIGRLLDDGVNPRHILAVTFTRRAAEELRERLASLRGDDQALPRADTLHALAHDQWARAFGAPPVLMDEDAARRVFAQANPDLSGGALKRAWQGLNLARERMERPEGLKDCAARYEAHKDSWDLVDYTDLIEFWLEQITSEDYLNSYTHILVDEVQDLSNMQLAAIRGLAGPQGQGLFAIGDPRQAIYGFRGAAREVRERFIEWWSGLEIIALEKNYRSGQAVLDLSGALYPDDPVLEAAMDREVGIQLFRAPSAQSEANWIGDRIRELIGSTSHSLADGGEHGTLSPGQIAVLVRFGALIGPIEQALERMGLPVSVPEKEPFWADQRVRTILDAVSVTLGIVTGLEDGEGLEVPEKVLARGPLGLSAYFEDNSSFDRFFWESGPFRQLVRQYDEQEGWGQLLTWINLQSELDQVGRSAEKVRVMSLHAAKGLEFEAVFLPAVEDGILPFAGMDTLMGKVSGGGGNLAADKDEEKRLFYVGLTRAKSHLFLSHAERRKVFGRGLGLPVSRFVGMLPEDMFKKSVLVARKVVSRKQGSLLDQS